MAIRFTNPDPDRDTHPDPDRDTGKTCLGGGMHCPTASGCCHMTCVLSRDVWRHGFSRLGLGSVSILVCRSSAIELRRQLYWLPTRHSNRTRGVAIASSYGIFHSRGEFSHLPADIKSQIPLRYLVRSWSPTSFEPDSVMEFGFEPVCDQLRTS